MAVGAQMEGVVRAALTPAGLTADPTHGDLMEEVVRRVDLTRGEVTVGQSGKPKKKTRRMKRRTKE
jgi:hypothetical protein